MKKLLIALALVATCASAQHHHHHYRVPHRDLYVGLDIASFVLDLVAPRPTTIVQPTVVAPPVVQPTIVQSATVLPPPAVVYPGTTYVVPSIPRYYPWIPQPVFPRVVAPPPPPRFHHYHGPRPLPPVYRDAPRHISRPPHR